MIDKAQLKQMKNADITQADRSALVDIRNIHIDGSLPAVKKMQGADRQSVLFSLRRYARKNTVCRRG